MLINKNETDLPLGKTRKYYMGARDGPPRTAHYNGRHFGATQDYEQKKLKKKVITYFDFKKIIELPKNFENITWGRGTGRPGRHIITGGTLGQTRITNKKIEKKVITYFDFKKIIELPKI